MFGSCPCEACEADLCSTCLCEACLCCEASDCLCEAASVRDLSLRILSLSLGCLSEAVSVTLTCGEESQRQIKDSN